MAVELFAYSGLNTNCRKCANKEASIRYVGKLIALEPTGEAWSGNGGIEAMLRICERCGYSWAEDLPSSATRESRGEEYGDAPSQGRV